MTAREPTPFAPDDDQMPDDVVIADNQGNPDQLFDMIPEGEQYNFLRWSIQRIATSFAGSLGDITPQRLQSWIDEIASGDGRTGKELREDIFRYVVGADQIMEQFGADADQAEKLITGEITFSDWIETNGQPGMLTGQDDSPPPGAMGGSDEYPGVMPGGTLVQVAREGQDDLFLMAYEFPPGSGQYLTWQFSSPEQVEATFGPDWLQSVPREWHDEGWLDDNATILDSSGEIIGMDVAFGTHFDNVVRETAQLSGITDPTLIGQMVNDPEIQQILAMGALGDWSEDRLLGELRNSTFWTQELYPGIEQFYASGSTDPEVDWKNYQQRMEQVYKAMGIQPEPGRGYRDMIGDDLIDGIDPSLAEDMVPVFQRASTSPQYAAVLDQWMQTELGQSLDFDTWFDVLAGAAPAEVGEVVEKATLQFVANQQSLDLTGSQLARLAESTSMSEAQAAAAFEDISAQLLALGDDLERYGLTEDDILASQTGIQATSGRSISEIKQIARKTALELGLADDQKINLYVGYDPTRGTPTRPGLASLAPTGG